ncbi:MAG: glycosyltransferase family 9 protein [Clostridiales bacterium]|nr:glycosyltransferase family 9 protein [Clostridiales bacterium]
MKNALLFRLGGLGDCLIALPSIQLIRRMHPAANLTLVCRRTCGQLLEEAGIINNVVEEDSRRLLPLFSSAQDPAAEQVRWLREFDSLIGWFSEKKDSVLEKNLGLICAGACVFFSYDGRSRQQMSRFFFQKTLKVGLNEGKEAVSFEECALLHLPSVGGAGVLGKEMAKETAVKFVVVHPGSGSEKKCWPIRNFLAVIERLARKKVCGVVVTGEAEERIRVTLTKASLPGGWSWIHLPSLSTLSRLLSEADLYFGNDSGVTHLAAACGTEVLALFRKDLAIAWKPYGRVHLLAAESVGSLSFDNVWAKISSLLCLS